MAAPGNEQGPCMGLEQDPGIGQRHEQKEHGALGYMGATRP